MSGSAHKSIPPIPEELHERCLPIKAFCFGCDYTGKGETPLDFIPLKQNLNYASPCGVSSRGPSQIQKHFATRCWWCEQHRATENVDPIPSSENKTLHAVADDRNYVLIDATLRDADAYNAIEEAIAAWERANPTAGGPLAANQSRVLPMLPVTLANDLPLLLKHRAIDDGATETYVLRPGAYAPCHICGDVCCNYQTLEQHTAKDHGYRRPRGEAAKGVPIRRYTEAVPFKGEEEANLINHQFKRQMLESIGFTARPPDEPRIDLSTSVSTFLSLFNFRRRPLTFDSDTMTMEVTWTNRLIYGNQRLRNPTGVGSARHNSALTLTLTPAQQRCFQTGRDNDVTTVTDQAGVRELERQVETGINTANRLRLQRSELRETVRSLQSDKTTLENTNRDLEVELRELRPVTDNYTNLQTRMAAETRAKVAAEEERDRLQTQLTEATTELREARQRIANLEKEVDERKRKRNLAGAEISPAK